LVESQSVELLYPEAVLRDYFDSDKERQIARIRSSIKAANDFRTAHPDDALIHGGQRLAGLKKGLQYYKDETFVTLYAFVSLDLCGRPPYRREREQLYSDFLRAAFGDERSVVTDPVLTLEKQVVPSGIYLDSLKKRFAEDREGCHPVWYLRQLGAENKSPEGSTHTDALLTLAGDCRVMIEAKFLSDMSYDTRYAPERDQVSRNLDAGLFHARYDLARFWYVFVSPARFRERPHTRLYGYRLGEYRDPATGADALRRDLPHLADPWPAVHIDFDELRRHIGWVTWEEICSLVMASPVFHEPEFPRARFETFFRERCLWPRDGGYC